MFDFRSLATTPSMFVLYHKGFPVDGMPLTQDELAEAIIDLPVSEAEAAFIDTFFEEVSA